MLALGRMKSVASICGHVRYCHVEAAWSGGVDRVYQRVLLKLSGEALMGSSSFGIDPDVAGLNCPPD